jgi:tellurite resistance protein TerB
MGFWDNLKNKVSDMSQSLQTNVSKFKNDKFADASMAMCALVAAADGTIDPDERKKTAGFIMSNPSLQAFDSADLQKRFNYFCDKLSADFDFGKVEAIQALSKLKGKEEQARACIQVGIIIGGADGDFDSDEKAVVKEACHAVGLGPHEFDL